MDASPRGPRCAPSNSLGAGSAITPSGPTPTGPPPVLSRATTRCWARTRGSDASAAASSSVRAFGCPATAFISAKASAPKGVNAPHEGVSSATGGEAYPSNVGVAPPATSGPGVPSRVAVVAGTTSPTQGSTTPGTGVWTAAARTSRPSTARRTDSAVRMNGGRTGIGRGPSPPIQGTDGDGLSPLVIVQDGFWVAATTRRWATAAQASTQPPVAGLIGPHRPIGSVITNAGCLRLLACYLTPATAVAGGAATANADAARDGPRSCSPRRTHRSIAGHRGPHWTDSARGRTASP